MPTNLTGAWYIGCTCGFDPQEEGSTPSAPANLIMSGIYSFKICINCGLIKRSNGKKYCSQTCKANFLYKEKVSLWLNGKLSGIRGKTSTAYWIKRYILETRGHRCESCKNDIWMDNKIPLDLDHIDGNFLNNKIDNLKLLCYNCHGLTPTYKGKNKNGRPRTKYYRGL